MEQALTHVSVTRCQGTRATLFRVDPEGRGIFLWCKGHHKEELRTWAELGLTTKICLQLIHKAEDNLI